MSKTGSAISYAYNADGQRIAKTYVNGETTTEARYYYAGNQLAKMTRGDKTLVFTYDSLGPRSVVYNGSNYYYLRNAQGDVLGIVNAYGTVVASYTYDVWGNVLSVTGSMSGTLGTLNPLRYRGYVYDTETKLYYLNSRYYNPATGRFINADTPEVATLSPGSATWDKNLFAYCDNDPVNRKDDGGQCWEAIAIGFIAGIAGQYISDVISNISSGKTGLDVLKPTSSGADYFASGLGGAIAAIPGLNAIGTIAVGAAGSVTTDYLKGNINSWEDLGKSALRGAAANGVGYLAAKGVAAAKVKQIESMPRAAKKIYLRDNFYCNSQASVNINLKTFSNATMGSNIKVLESRLFTLKSGLYSTISATIASLTM